MTDELNQVPEISEVSEDGLFDDYTPVDETENTEESATAEETVQPDPFGLKVTYNGEEQTLNEEDARSYAQKGMNYDRIYEPLQRLARMNGLNSVGEYLNMLNDTQVNYEISKEMEELRNNPRYESVSDEVLEEIATAKVNENIGNQDRIFQEQQQGEADAQQAKVERDVQLFFKEYPEFQDKDPSVLDPKVFDYINEGYTLLEAYNKWSREQANSPQAQAREKVSRQNEENKKRSLGNTTNVGKVDSDDFLNGFLNG